MFVYPKSDDTSTSNPNLPARYVYFIYLSKYLFSLCYVLYNIR